MHAAVEVQDPARTEPTAASSSITAGAQRRLGEASLWIGALLVIVSLSLADSLVSDVVPYERDTIVFYFPLMNWVGQQLQHGHLPLWTPQFFGGYPIFADGEIGLAYPPVLLALLTLPPDRAFVALRLLHLSIAAVGIFAFARTWRLPYASATLAGVIFTSSSFLQAQMHHENIVRTASWLPLLLACVEIGLRAESWHKRLRWTALGAVALGLAGLSLHVEMLAIELLVLAAYGTFRWAVGPLAVPAMDQTWLRRLLGVARVCVPVVLLGLTLAAVQLLPLLELASFSARGAGIPYSESAAYSLTPFGLFQLIFPYVFRAPGNQQWGLWTHWESYLYVGLAPLALVIVALACVRRREIAGWAAIGGLGIVLSLGQYSPIGLHYLLWLVPGLSSLRAPGRFTFVVVLAAAMLAAYGLAWLMEAPRRSCSLRRVIVGLSVGTACTLIGLVGMHAALLLFPSRWRAVIQAVYLSLPRDSYPLTAMDVYNGLLWSTDLGNPRVLGALVGLLVVVGALWLWGRSARPDSPMWPRLFVGFATFDLLLFGWAIHPREPLSKISAEPPSVQAIEQLPSVDAAPNRVLASPVLNQVAADRLAPFGSVQEASGYSSLQFIWHRDYLGRVLYADDALLDLWGVRYILDPARYGTLSNYRGVDYLAQQALLHGPAGSALAEQRFVLNSTSPIVELRFITALIGAVDVDQGTPVAEIELRDASDEVVATGQLLAGRDTMEWAWNSLSVQPYVRHQRVEVAGTATESLGPEPRTRSLSFADLVFDRPIGATTIVVRATSPVGEFALYGGAAIGADGGVHQLFGKTNAKYRQAYADSEIRVLEDTAAFPRAFVVPRARVAPSLGTALHFMVHQPFHPDQEAILADDTTTQGTSLVEERGGQGTAKVTAYVADDVRVHTSASADAWLVLSDTFYPGWKAFVDGQPAPVLRGDVLFRVVPIPGGEHDVEFRFEPLSVDIGLAISLIGLLVVLGCLVVAGRARSPGRTT